MGNNVDCLACFDTPNLIISIATGDTKGAGLHNAAYVTFLDRRGNQSREIALSGCCITVYKKGHTDTFVFGDFLSIGTIWKMQLVRRDPVQRVDWFVEKVVVKRCSMHDGQVEDLIFPCHRWLKNNQPIVLTVYDSVLPQFEPETQQREVELFWKRTMYRYHRRRPGVPPQISFCPQEEVFSWNHKWDLLVRRQALISKDNLPDLGAEPWRNLHDFDETFRRKLGTPMGRDRWKEDLHFARQRLSGCNPTLISLCTELPDNFNVSSAMVEPLLEQMSLDEALKNRRIFIVNLKCLNEIELEGNRKVASPMALFFLNKQRNLTPIAIQLFQTKGNDNPVFLPSDPWYTWSLAKMWFNNADAQYHRACALIGFSHLLVEAISIATHRQLSPSHPVFRLLAPFLRCVIPINCFEVNELLAPGSWLDLSTSLGSKGTLDLVAHCWENWRLDVQGYLPNDLKNRGVDDPDVLPDYPYRDDGLLLHQAIENYTRAVIEGIYDREDKLEEDEEIKAWALELSSEENSGCGIKGVPEAGKFPSTEELIMTLTSIMYACTVGHAAVNGPQYDEYAFLPNYPALLKGEPPRDKRWRDEAELILSLPPKNVSLDIMVVTRLLTERQGNGLANFNAQYQYDPASCSARAKFVDELKCVALTIMDRNRKRAEPYEYLNPGKSSN